MIGYYKEPNRTANVLKSRLLHAKDILIHNLPIIPAVLPQYTKRPLRNTNKQVCHYIFPYLQFQIHNFHCNI